MAQLNPSNSTNVRTENGAPLSLRLAFAALGAVAPSLAARAGEQGADGGNTEHAQCGARRLPHETPPREPQRVHRRTSLSPLRRSSAHDATTVAVAPSGTAIAVQVSTTSRVIRTKMSAVSYFH